MFSVRTKGDVVGKVQCLSPVDNLAVRVMAILGAERGPADQALKHDGTQGPPITIKGVAVASEDFGSDVIGSSDGRVCHQSS